MKKKLYLIPLLCIAILLGCSNPSESQSETTYESDGTEVLHEEMGNTYTFKTFPRNIIYNDTSFILEEIEFYEQTIGYEKNLYILLYFDMNQMSEEDLYWFNKNYEETDMMNRPLYAHFHVDSESNNFDFKDLVCSNDMYFSDNYRVLVYTLDSYRYSMNGEDFSLAVYVEQGGTYEHTDDNNEISLLNKSDTYYYFGSFPKQIDDINVMEAARPSVFKALFK